MSNNVASPIPAGTVFETEQQSDGSHRPRHSTPATDAILNVINGKVPAISNGRMPVDIGAASVTIRSAGTNRSTTVTTTAMTIMPANANRQGWKVKNDGAVPVWVNFDGTATATAGSGNIQIPAGGYLASEPGFVETGAMSAITASGSVALTVREH